MDWFLIQVFDHPYALTKVLRIYIVDAVAASSNVSQNCSL